MARLACFREQIYFLRVSTFSTIALFVRPQALGSVSYCDSHFRERNLENEPNLQRMSRTSRLLVVMTFICALVPSLLQAQGTDSRKPDRTTQRWLPLPETKDGVDVSQQAELLRTIQSLVTRSDAEQLPKFSEGQLQSMERLFDQWKEKTGVTGLPDLASIPPEWIDRATQDQALREQARRLLERYAEDRQIPPDGPNSNPSGLRLPEELQNRTGNAIDASSGERSSRSGGFGREPSAPRSQLKSPAENRSNNERRSNPRPNLNDLGDPFESGTPPNGSEPNGSQRSASQPNASQRSGSQTGGLNRDRDLQSPRDAEIGSDSQGENPFERARRRAESDSPANPFDEALRSGLDADRGNRSDENPFERGTRGPKTLEPGNSGGRRPSSADTPSLESSRPRSAAESEPRERLRSEADVEDLIEQWRERYFERAGTRGSEAQGAEMRGSNNGSRNSSNPEGSTTDRLTPDRSGPAPSLPERPMPWSGDPNIRSGNVQSRSDQTGRDQRRSGRSESNSRLQQDPFENGPRGSRDAAELYGDKARNESLRSDRGLTPEPSPEQLAQLKGLLEQLARDQQFYERQRNRNSVAERSSANSRSTNESRRSRTRSNTTQSSTLRRAEQDGSDLQQPLNRYSNRWPADNRRSDAFPTSPDLNPPAGQTPYPSDPESLARGGSSTAESGSVNRYMRNYGQSGSSGSAGRSSPTQGDVQQQFDDLQMSLEEIGKMFENAGQGDSDGKSTADASGLANRSGNSTNGARGGSGSRSDGDSSNQSGNSNPASGSKRNRDGLQGDIKSQVERYGFGRTLQNIMQETLRREGASAGGEATSSSENSESIASASNRNSQDFARDASGEAITSARQSGSTNSQQQRSSRQNSNRNGGNNSESEKGAFSDMASSFWDAVQETPSGGGTNRSSGASSNASSGGGFAFSFGWEQLLTAFVVGALIVGALWLARRQFSAEAIAVREESKWAKQAIKSGLKTRTDVVRAYHHLVLRGSEPASRWWTHRVTEDHLRNRVPALSPMIGELTSIYEEARYLPPDFRLNDGQVESVRQALRQFEASGNLGKASVLPNVAPVGS